MKTIKIGIELYNYDELEKEAKDKAFFEHKDFLDSLETEYENAEGELIKEFIEHESEEVEESIRINEYLFFKDGEMAHITHFTGKHEKTGKTEFYLYGKTYTI
jgi:hypothetical protein